MAKPVLLEPMMSVEVVTPEDNMGDVIGDLNSRRGQIHAMNERGRGAGRHRARAAVGDVRLRRRPAVADPGPRVVLDGVRSYAEVPANVAKEIIAKQNGE